jgi:hypothetical protein
MALIRELLAGGPYLRALPYQPDCGGADAGRCDGISQAAITGTEQLLEAYDSPVEGASRPLPVGLLGVTAWADAVPSPIQAAGAEPAMAPAVWSPGEAGVAVSLVAGEALLSATDYQAVGRSLPLTVHRTYRSGTLGHGPLGAAGWHSSLFAHLRLLPTINAVVYHDGSGSVWTFLDKRRYPEIPEGWEDDALGQYLVPEGLGLRLRWVAGSGRWQLFNAEHGMLSFDADGRLVEISDRHRQRQPRHSQGNTLRLIHDGMGRLVLIEDELHRCARLTYYGSDDRDRYGLLKGSRKNKFAG